MLKDNIDVKTQRSRRKNATHITSKIFLHERTAKLNELKHAEETSTTILKIKILKRKAIVMSCRNRQAR